MQFSYNPSLVALCVMVAVLVSCTALSRAGGARLGWRRLAGGALAVGER